jgi:putative DNA primase/helicase
LAARIAWPGARLTIAADDDRYTRGNPGLTKATEAAIAVGALVCAPQFPEGVAGTDFNDMRTGAR